MSLELVDLRAKISPTAHAVLFAKSQTSGREMQEVLRELLDAWAEKEIHAATVLTRLARREGGMGESGGLAGESQGVQGSDAKNALKCSSKSGGDHAAR